MRSKDPKRSGGKRVTRSETVTVRLDPKLRYLAELAARKQRRTLSSFIEWAIEHSLDDVSLSERAGTNSDAALSIAKETDYLWDVDEPDRFARLALRYPELLSHDEQMLWKVICECGAVWMHPYDRKTRKFERIIRKESLMFDRLRLFWERFCAVANGTADSSTLPQSEDLNLGIKRGQDDSTS